MHSDALGDWDQEPQCSPNSYRQQQWYRFGTLHYATHSCTSTVRGTSKEHQLGLQASLDLEEATLQQASRYQLLPAAFTRHLSTHQGQQKVQERIQVPLTCGLCRCLPLTALACVFFPNCNAGRPPDVRQGWRLRQSQLSVEVEVSMPPEVQFRA